MATFTWTGAAGDGNFNNPMNWSPPQVPGAQDTAIIDVATSTTITVANNQVTSLSTNKLVTLNEGDATTFTFGDGTDPASFSNAGTFNLLGGYFGNTLEIDTPTLTLTGHGTLALTGGGNDHIEASSATDTLDNVNNTIEGVGQLGNGTLTLTNGASGIIDATTDSGDTGGALVLDTGAGTITNDGLLESTNPMGGGLILDATTVYGGTSGRILAAGGNVYLQAGATLAGGVLASSGGGAIIDNGGGTLDGTAEPVTNIGTIEVADGNALSLLGSIVNGGTIALEPTYFGASLGIGPAAGGGTVTLSGGGTISLTADGAGDIVANGPGDALVDSGDQITGAGHIGDGSALGITNSATINANGASQLFIDSTGTVTNDGLLEATNPAGAGLVIADTVGNASGSILADGGNVLLQGADIEGGTLESSNGGAIIDNGGATLGGSASAVVNTGQFELTDGNALTLLGTVTDHGTITLVPTYFGVTTYVGPGTGDAAIVTLAGDGVLDLAGDGASNIVAGEAGDTLNNVNDLIEGAGQIGHNSTLTVTNTGTIDANAGAQLVINSAGPVTNDALMEATDDSAGLVFADTVNNSAGTILAAGADVFLQGGDIEGGRLETTTVGTIVGAIVDNDGGTLDGSLDTVTNLGEIDLADGNTLSLLGALSNQGTIALDGSYFGDTLLVTSPTLTLTGSGTLSLSDFGNNDIQGSTAATVLDNVDNTIEGAGELGHGALTLINETGGVIDGSAVANSLVLGNGSAAITNDGLIEATNTGGLTILDVQVNNSGSGLIDAAGGNVLLQGNATISGGTLESADGGAIIDDGGANLDGLDRPVTNTGELVVTDGELLGLFGTIVNQGTFAIEGSYFGDTFEIDSPTLTLTGGGTVSLSDFSVNFIYGATPTTMLDNIDNTIQGAGQFGNGQLTLVNRASGVIDANAAGNALVLGNGSAPITNDGLIESNGAGGLTITNVRLDDSGGGSLVAAGGNVTISDGATIAGSTLTSTGGVYIISNTGTLDGSAQALTNASTVDITDGSTLDLLGLIVNTGTIALDGSYFGDALLAASPTLTLNGGGTVSLSDFGGNIISGSTTATVLDNVDNIIEGAGKIGDGALVLNNESAGIIDADAANNALVLGQGSAAISNHGVIESTGAGGLVIANVIVDNDGGGVIDAYGGNVYLQNGATLQGGTLSTAGANAIIDTAGATLDGAPQAVTSTGLVELADGNYLDLLGSIVNTGTFAIDGSYFGVTLGIGPDSGDPGTVTLSGGGTFSLSDFGGNYLAADQAGDTLVNTDNIIEGAGKIGNGTDLGFVNDGTISATGGNAITLNSTATIVNNALIEAAAPGGGGIVINSIVTNHGTLLADGGNVILQGGTISGGLLESGTSGTVTGLFIAESGGVLDGSSGAITNAGALEIPDGNTAFALGKIINSGTIALGGSYFGDTLSITSPVLTLTGGGVVSLSDFSGNTISGATPTTLLNNVNNVIEGAGSISADLVDTGTVLATDSGNDLRLAEVSGSGTISAVAGATVDLTAGGALTEIFSGTGTLQLDNATPYTLGDATIGIASVLVDQGVTLSGSGTITGAVTNLGTIIVNGGTLTVDGALSGSGSFDLGDSTTGALNHAVGAGQTVNFASLATLNLADPVDFGGTIAGFANGDAIDLTQVAYDASGTAQIVGNDMLQVTENGDTYDLQLSGNYTGDIFHLAADGAGSEILLEGTPCYCRGTLILTDHGEIAVEHLQIGDRLITLSGEARPIRWIGRRAYNGRFAAGNRDIMPVCITRGALADNVPARDLHVSPLHAMFLDGVLIPAIALVNGISIVQQDAVDQVEYFHLELESHDILLAEGAPSESFVDDDSRGMFHNHAEYRALYPDAAPLPARYCAPRLEEGEQLEAICRRILARARPAAQAPAPAGRKLRGHLDALRHDRIAGWALDETSPQTPVPLRILADNRLLGEVLAHDYRTDLQDAGIGDGRHGFALEIPGGLLPDTHHVISVEHATDGRRLDGAPFLLQATETAPPGHDGVPLRCRGWLDFATRDCVGGWAWDEGRPHARLRLAVLVNGVPVARIVANRHRPDLAEAGIGDGRHGFTATIPGGLSPAGRHAVQVVVEAGGADIENSPIVIESSAAFDPTFEQAVGDAVAAIAADATAPQAQVRVLDFLAAQADRLRQIRADAESGRATRLIRRQRRLQQRTPAEDPGPRALVIDDEAPDRSRDAGSQAVLSHMQALQALGYRVSFVAAADPAVDEDAAARLAADGIAVCRSPFYASVEEVLRRQAGGFDLIYLHRISNASAYLALARQHCPRARLIYAVADLHHLRLARQAQIEGRPELLGQSRRLRLAECTASLSTDVVITHSPREADWLRTTLPDANVHVVPWAIPHRRSGADWPARGGVAFIANFAHAPNQDAARVLAEDIMPLVWRQAPDIECSLIGSRMPDRIRRLARPGLVAVGHVPDLGSILGSVRLTVAPLRFGAGLKGKVLESLAAGTPCVMSPIAAEGIDLPAVLAGLVADSAADIAERILLLHADKAAWRRASRAGSAFMKTAFTAEHVTAALRHAIAPGAGMAMEEAERTVAMRN